MRQDNFNINIGKIARIFFSDYGLDEKKLLQAANLPVDLFDTEDGNISIDAYFRLSEALDAEVQDPYLALKLGDVELLEYFDPAFFAAMCSPNMNKAISTLTEYKKLVSPFIFDVDTQKEKTIIEFRCKSHHTIPRILALAEVVFLVNFARRATRCNIEPISVAVPFKLTHSLGFEKHFGCEITFGATISICLSAEDAERPFLTRDDRMWNFFEPHLQRKVRNNQTSLSTRERVKHALTELLPNGRAHVDIVAKELAMSKRTLQRRLTLEGTTWLEVLNNTRSTLAKHYLINTDMSTIEISFLLGFENPNSLYRAFKSWENMSPETWRTRNRM